MLLIGPLSSAYDFLTFAVMLWVFHAGADLFRTGWFVESLATQTLVIFVIRTADRPWASRPSRALGWGVGGCAAAGAVLPFTPLAPWLGFTPLPPLFFAIPVRHGRDLPRRGRGGEALVLPAISDVVKRDQSH